MAKASNATTNTSAQTPKPKPTKKKEVKLNDTVMVSSGVYGSLLYVSHRTGERIQWDNFGDTSPMTVQELINMRNSQRAFFENQWVFIEGDNAEDVIKYLNIGNYYRDIKSIEDIDIILQTPPEEFAGVVARFNAGTKDNIARRAKALVDDGVIRDINMIRAIEQGLNVSLS